MVVISRSVERLSDGTVVDETLAKRFGKRGRQASFWQSAEEALLIIGE